MRSRLRLGAVGCAAVLLSVATAGSAWGYFVSLGTGTAPAATGNAQPVTLTPGTAAPTLVPGGRADVVSVAANPGASSLRVSSLVLDTAQGSNGFAVDPAHSGCGLGAFSYREQTNGGAGWTVPAGGSITLSLTDAVGAAVDTGNDCQGATLTVFLRAA